MGVTDYKEAAKRGERARIMPSRVIGSYTKSIEQTEYDFHFISFFIYFLFYFGKITESKAHKADYLYRQITESKAHKADYLYRQITESKAHKADYLYRQITESKAHKADYLYRQITESKAHKADYLYRQITESKAHKADYLYRKIIQIIYKLKKPLFTTNRKNPKKSQ